MPDAWTGERAGAAAAAVAALVAGAPGALDTLDELAAALADDANLAATITTALAGKAPTIVRDTAANLASGNAVLAAGRIAETTDTRVFAIGDGATAWNSLPKYSRLPLGPVVAQKTDGNLTLANTSSAWTDVDAGGTASARPLDVVIPNVSAGQWVTIAPAFSLTATGAFAVLFDIFTIVAGAPVHQFGSSNFGVTPWVVGASTAKDIAAPISYQLVAGDIENGSARLRLRYIGTGARTISANGGLIFRLEGRGPFA